MAAISDAIRREAISYRRARRPGASRTRGGWLRRDRRDGHRRPLADDEVRLHPSLALDLDRVARLELEHGRQERLGRRGHVNAPWHAVRLHAARRVHGVAPQVVDELLLADDTGDDRP